MIMRLDTMVRQCVSCSRGKFLAYSRNRWIELNGDILRLTGSNCAICAEDWRHYREVRSVVELGGAKLLPRIDAIDRVRGQNKRTASNILDFERSRQRISIWFGYRKGNFVRHLDRKSVV